MLQETKLGFTNPLKLASNVNDESTVPIEKPFDIPNFTIEEAAVGSNVTSQHSEMTTHGKNTVTPKLNLLTSFCAKFTTRSLRCGLLLPSIAKKVGDEHVEPINECPSIYATKLSSTLSIMATIRKLDANVPNDADYDIWSPKASVHEVRSMARISFDVLITGAHGSEDEVDHVDNEMASFLAKTSLVGYGTKERYDLEQCEEKIG
ncbi:hypothetical protein Tco_0154176 [Tanacetum coccineum]